VAPTSTPADVGRGRRTAGAFWRRPSDLLAAAQTAAALLFPTAEAMAAADSAVEQRLPDRTLV